MSIIQDQPTIHGKQNIYSKQMCVCKPLRNRLEVIKNYNPQRQQKDARVLQVWLTS